MCSIKLLAGSDGELQDVHRVSPARERCERVEILINVYRVAELVRHGFGIDLQFIHQ